MSYIGTEAFRRCSAVTSIIIPNKLSFIHFSVFQDCVNLSSLTIPNSVTSIGDYAFYGCSLLTSIHSESDQPADLEDHVFSENVYQSATLYIPKGSIDNYKFAIGWKHFDNMVEE